MFLLCAMPTFGTVVFTFVHVDLICVFVCTRVACIAELIHIIEMGIETHKKPLKHDGEWLYDYKS